MKTKTFLFAVISLFLLVMIVGCEEESKLKVTEEEQSNGQTQTRLAKERAWDYRVKPGTAEWSLLKDEKERIAAVQIPEDVLMSSSSEEIVDMVIDFPLFGYFTAFNTPQEGFLIMLYRFNLFKHLLSRKDVGKDLIAVYKDAGMSGFEKKSYSNEFWTIKLKYLELILSQNEIIESLTEEEKLELIIEAKNKLEKKGQDESFRSLPSFQSSTLMMVKILKKEKYGELENYSNKQKMDEFIESGTIEDAVSLINDVVRLTDNFIKDSNNKKLLQ